MTEEINDAVEWRPQWTGEKKEQFDRLRAQYAREISVLRDVRKALALTQVEAAEILDMTQSNVSKLERGDPTLSTIQRMVSAKGGKVTLQVTSADGKELAIAL